MLVLGFESSCDETGVALYDHERGLLAHALHSQVAMHRDYGGVVPELASRDHIRRTIPLLRKVLDESGYLLDEVGAVAYTQGPGLAGALLVGAAFAEALATSLGVPTVPVHHLEGHLLSPLLSSRPPRFPSTRSRPTRTRSRHRAARRSSTTTSASTRPSPTTS